MGKNEKKGSRKLLAVFLCMLAAIAVTAGALLYMANNDVRGARVTGTAAPAATDAPEEGESLLSRLLDEGVLPANDREDGEDGEDEEGGAEEDGMIPVAAVVTPTPVPTPVPTPTPAPTPMPEPVSIVLSAVGDCTLGGDANTSGSIKRFEDYAKKNGYGYYFKNVAGIFESDDITVIDLEGPLTTSKSKRSGRRYNFRGDPANAQILTGVDVVSCANSHSYDFKEQGFQDTKAAVEAQGIGFAGFTDVYFTEIKGVPVGVLGVTPLEYTTETITRMVQEAKAQCRILIVTVHWGDDRQEKPTEAQYKLGCAIIDAGGDVVLGNLSHVVGGIHMYKDRYIVYSMGNFCYGGHKNPADKDCMIFQQTFDVAPDGTVTDGGINVIPCSMSTVNNKNDYCPTPVTGTRAKTVLQKVARRSINIDISGLNWADDFIGYDLGVVKRPAGTGK